MSKQSLTTDRWRELIGQQRGSGLSIAQFCGRHCVAVSSFFFWRRKLKAVAAPTFVELTPAVEPASILRASESELRMPIELQLRCGTIVRVREGFDVNTLRQVVEALR